MKNFYQKSLIYVKAHKIISGIVALVVIFGGVYVYNKTKPAAPTKYVLAAVTKDTLSTAVSGSGQISASDEVTLNPKESGAITSVDATAGQKVTKGQLIATIDSTNAASSLSNAKLDLEEAQLALQKLEEPADADTVTSAQNDLSSATSSLATVNTNLANDYKSSYNTIADNFNDIPTILKGLNSIITNGQTSPYISDSAVQANTNLKNYKDEAYQAYTAANNKYQEVQIDYHDYNTTTSSTSSLETLLGETSDLSSLTSDAVKKLEIAVNYAISEATLSPSGESPAMVTDKNNLDSFTNEINTDSNNILSSTNAIQNDKNEIVSDTQNVTLKTEALQKINEGTQPIDITSQELSVQQKQNALTDAENALDDYSIRAPFDGVLAALNVHVGDQVGAATDAGTVVTQNQIADIPLNEVDAAKIQVGDKATLTFQALPDLSATGEVVQVDSLGTVSQGVVTYTIEIALDTEDDQIKPNMSVDVDIITATKQDVLVVPNAAIQTQNGNSYVKLVSGLSESDKTTGESSSGIALSNAPILTPVAVGISNDTETEITSGLNEGDEVVIKTIASTAAKTTTQSSGLSLLGGGAAGRTAGGGAAAGRALGR